MEANQEIDNFCKNVVTLRKRHSLSKKKMAKILGIGAESLNKLENGIVPKRMDCIVLIKLSAVFGISIDELLSDSLLQ